MNIYLESERIYLREFSSADEDELFDLDSDPNVMKYLTNGVPSTRDNIQKMLSRVSLQLKQSHGKYGVWAAVKKETGEFIGWFHLFPPRNDPNNTENLFLGYRLKVKYWGNGYATEVAKVLIQKAFQEYGVKKIFAQAMKTNKRSQNVMTAAGMSFVSEFKEPSFPRGFEDAVLFSIACEAEL